MSYLELKKLAVTSLLLLFALQLCAQNRFTLKKALHEARESNLYLKAMSYDIEIAATDITTARLRPNPLLNNQSLQLLRSSSFAPDTRFYNNRNRQVWWQFTKQVQIADKRNLKTVVARKNVLLARHNVRDFERNLLNEVARKWVDLWLLKINLKATRHIQQRLDSLVTVNETLPKDKMLSGIELTRLQISSGQYQYQADNIEQELLTEIPNLQFMLNTALAIDIAEDDVFDMPALEQPLDTLLNLSFRNRSDINMARVGIEAASANTDLQRAMAKPNLDVGVIYNPQNSIPYAGIFATIPLAIYDRNQGEIQKSRLMLAQTEENLKATELKTRTEVTTAYQRYQHQKQNVKRVQRILDQSQHVLNLINRGYPAAYTSSDLMDAQQAVYEALVMYNETLANLKRSQVQLLFATGLISDL